MTNYIKPINLPHNCSQFFLSIDRLCLNNSVFLNQNVICISEKWKGQTSLLGACFSMYFTITELNDDEERKKFLLIWEKYIKFLSMQKINFWFDDKKENYKVLRCLKETSLWNDVDWQKLWWIPEITKLSSADQASTLMFGLFEDNEKNNYITLKNCHNFLNHIDPSTYPELMNSLIDVYSKQLCLGINKKSWSFVNEFLNFCIEITGCYNFVDNSLLNKAFTEVISRKITDSDSVLSYILWLINHSSKESAHSALLWTSYQDPNDINDINILWDAINRYGDHKKWDSKCSIEPWGTSQGSMELIKYLRRLKSLPNHPIGARIIQSLLDCDILENILSNDFENSPQKLSRIL